MDKLFENDENIAKYGKNYEHYENLKFFNFPENSNTKEFCETLITIKIKVTNLITFAGFNLGSWIASIALWIMLISKFFNDNKQVLIIAVCLTVLATIFTCYVAWSFYKIFLLVKKIFNLEQINQLPELKKTKTISLVYFFTGANFICFSAVTIWLMYFIVKKAMNKLSTNPEILGISKKDESEIIKQLSGKSAIK
ncbi:hypothetical protein [Malacoplasma penetrans]|nr:hypothetical protein [Malacoplasma penetrans]